MRVPHINATLANKLFEYMALALPVIVSDVPPMLRVLAETGCGLSFRSGDAADLARTIERLGSRSGGGAPPRRGGRRGRARSLPLGGRRGAAHGCGRGGASMLSSPGQSANPPPRFGLGRSLLFSAILILLCFGLIEGALRAYVYVFRSPAERFDLATNTFVLLPGTYPTPNPDPIVVNSRGFIGAEFEDPPPPGTLRIVTVGDSCTFGQGSLRGTYPALLEERLQADADGRRYQVVNAAIQGMNSELALRRLESRVVPLHPDLVTIYIGWNDLMKFDPEGQVESPRMALMARWLDRLWTVKGLRKLLFYNLRPRLAPPLTGPQSRTGRYADYHPAVFEHNLRTMIATARGIPATVVVMTLPTVVRDDMNVEDVRRAGVQFPYFRGANAVGDLARPDRCVQSHDPPGRGRGRRVRRRSRARNRCASRSPHPVLRHDARNRRGPRGDR